jgi:Tfp pilus assembly protein FimV
LGVVLTAAHAGAAFGGTTTAPERSPHVERVVVQPGDTLWSIAERLAPNSDPRTVVDQLVSTLGTSSVQPGEVIRWSI